MTTIQGPKIQIKAGAFVDQSGQPTPEGLIFLSSIQQTAFNSTRSGPSTSRPTSAITGRWIGMPYYDTTLGYVIHLHSVDPDVWHNSAGAPV
jgi:hypothetical protein